MFEVTSIEDEKYHTIISHTLPPRLPARLMQYLISLAFSSILLCVLERQSASNVTTFKGGSGKCFVFVKKL